MGKSTLYNRLTGTRHAIVDDQPGVTRDRREGDASLAAMRFRLIDTAGLENAQPGSLEDRMRKQTELAVSQADVTMLVIDGRSGLLPDDLFFARQIRKAGANVIVLVNKCEGQAGRSVPKRGSWGLASLCQSLLRMGTVCQGYMMHCLMP